MAVGEPRENKDTNSHNGANMKHHAWPQGLAHDLGCHITLTAKQHRL